MRLLLPALLFMGSAATLKRPEAMKDLSHAVFFPELEIGSAHIHAVENRTSPALSNVFFDGEEKPCGKDRPCKDGACCNEGGNCGFGDEYCSKNPPANCLSNCDAKAKCGINSRDGKVKCPLNLCCSDYGYCGTEEEYCTREGEKKCQKDFGGCEVRKAPSCGKDSNTATGGRRMGYYASWNVRNRHCNRVWPKHLEVETFTHITFAFASMNPQTFEMVPADPGDVNLYEQFTAKKSSTLETWIAVGGWEFSENHTSTRHTWSTMAQKEETRASFIKSSVAFMEKYGFQGLDLDWEYPSAGDRNGRAIDKENFVSLVRELRKAFSNRFGLSVAIPASFPYLQGFDLKPMEQYVDWFNLMSYDLHGLWDANFVGSGPYMLPHTSLKELERMLVPFWFTTVDPKNVNFGMARYGRGYTVKDKSCHNLGCEFAKGNVGGKCTDVESSLSNEEIRHLINEKNLVPELDTNHSVNVLKWDDQLVAYDDYITFEMKKDMANNYCFGGVFIWTIDFTGRGSGNKPNIDRDPTGEDLEGQHFDSDAFLHPNIWYQQYPQLECIPSCTMMLPPFILLSATTITWPPFETTFLSIGGGQTGTWVKEKTSLVGGTITKVMETVLTVDGASIGTYNTKISIPPFTTDRIEFYPVTVEQTDSAGAIVQPIPSIMPPSTMLNLPSTLRTFPPTPFEYEGEPPRTTNTSSPTPLWFSFGSTDRPWKIQPQPTVPIPLPKDLPKRPDDCSTVSDFENRKDCKTPIWPVLATFTPVPPRLTCDTPGINLLCGHKNCALFGCGCGPLGLPFGPGCNTGCKGSILNDLLGICFDGDNDDDNDSDKEQDNRTNNDDKDDRKKKDKKDKKKNDDNDTDTDDDDDNEDDDDDHTDGGGSDDEEDEQRYKDDSGRKPKPGGPPKPGPKPKPGDPTKPPGPSKTKPPPPETTKIGGNCGKFSCDGGCGPWGCGGGCGIQGCGFKCIGGHCISCPLEKCGGPECVNGGCVFPSNYPRGKPGGCDKDKQTRVTDYFISCTKFDQASSSCKTTWSVIHTGCAITGTKSTTTKGPGCTRVPLSLDDDQGDDNGDPPSRTSKSDESEQPKPTGDPDWMRRKCNPGGWCGCCLDYYYWCKTQATECKDNKDSANCIKTCLRNMCWNDDSPEMCHYGKECGDSMDFCLPEKGNHARRSVSDWQRLDARMRGLGGPANNLAIPTPN